MILPATLAHLLPEDRLGLVHAVAPLGMGQSGARVYAVTSERGEFVLRVQGTRVDPSWWAQHILVQRRAAEVGVGPALIHVDDAARAVVQTRVVGVPLGAALGEPEQRARALTSAVDKLRALHAVDAGGVHDRDVMVYLRAAYEPLRGRPGFPAWVEPDVERIRAVYTGDPRRVVSHNDVNPTNVLWDGEAAWLVDWDVAGLNHPLYDLAVLATFLLLPDEAVLGLIARHDGEPPDERTRVRFASLRHLAGSLCGLTFLGLVSDLGVVSAPTRDEAPTLAACYAELRHGTLDLQSPRGRMSLALALLRTAMES